MVEKQSCLRGKRVAVGILIAVLAVLGFGVLPGDSAAFESFAEGTGHGQEHPEFRAVAYDYVVRGSRAMRTHPFGVPSRGLIMAIRSAPLLPKKFAVNPTSRLHYESFSRGPLCAYLHLCSEQSPED